MTANSPLGVSITGLATPGTPDRPASAWLSESLSFLALVATRDTYAAQPRLWELGEYGRARTIEDFEHHLRAAMTSDRQWDEHLAYCVSLFAQRGFPLRWLTDAFATLARVLAENLPDDVVAEIRRRLAAGPAIVNRLAEQRGLDPTAPTRYDA